MSGSHRREQMASVLERAIQSVLARGLQDPRMRGLLTVTSVEPSPDLRTATVYISVLPKEHEDLTLHALKDASAHIRRRVGDVVRMRVVPTLHFKVDLGMRRQAEVYDALTRINAEREAEAGDQESPPAEGEES